MGKAVKAVTKASPALGSSTGRDLLFGERQAGGFARLDPDVAATQRAARDIQRRGLAKLKEVGKEDPTAVAKRQTEQAVKAQRQALSDTRRRLQENIARRGLGTSSLGLAQQTGLQRQAAQAITGERAALADRIRQARMGQAQALIGGGGQVLGQPGMVRQFQRGGRAGGLAPVVGAGLGAMLGGPGGAQAGMGMGQALQSGYGQTV